MSIHESHVEQEVLGWFEDLGYEVVFGPELAPDGANPERASYKRTILAGRLTDALHRLNPGLPAAAIADAVGLLPDAGEVESAAIWRDCLSVRAEVCTAILDKVCVNSICSASKGEA